MTVILKDTVPSITEIAKLGYAAVAVYSLMYQSAYQDLRYDKRKYRKWQDRRDCGGPTNWSHKAIAETLHMGKAKVIAANCDTSMKYIEEHYFHYRAAEQTEILGKGRKSLSKAEEYFDWNEELPNTNKAKVTTVDTNRRRSIAKQVNK